MYKNIMSLLFIVTFLYSEESIYNNNYWKKLLHYNGENHINSEFFFLSNNNPSPKEEFEKTVKLLNSNNAKTIACNFPARYNWLKSKNIAIKNIDLKTCKDLDNFYNEFKKDKVYLVFTSEYINSPSSAFGHIMLVFNDKNSPFEIADTIHYAAKTKDDGFFTYSYKGLNGKYSAYFLREPFFKKIYEYNTLEQRYMYINELDFTKEQIDKLIYHIYELRKSKFKYYFLNGNCSSEIINFLELAFDREPFKEPFHVLPIDALKKYKNNITKTFRYLPLNVKIDYLTSKMNKKQLGNFEKIIKDNSFPPKGLDDITKEALVDYYTFLFRKFRKSYKNYDDIMDLNYKKTTIEDKTPTPLEKTQASKISVGFLKNKKENRVSFEYRPLLLSIDDIQNTPLQESEVDIFSFDFSVKNSIKLESFDLVSMKSFPKHLNFFKPPSWQLYLGANRENEKDDLLFDSYFGLGQTKSLWNNNIAITISFGLDSDLEKTKAYLSPEINIFNEITKNLKIGIKHKYKEYFSKNYKENSFFINYRLSKSYNLSFDYKKVDNYLDEKYNISLNYNF